MGFHNRNERMFWFRKPLYLICLTVSAEQGSAGCIALLQCKTLHNKAFAEPSDKKTPKVEK